jgi:hypothetical protein
MVREVWLLTDTGPIVFVATGTRDASCMQRRVRIVPVLIRKQEPMKPSSSLPFLSSFQQ